MSGEVEGLECSVGATRVLIAAEYIQRVVEYPVSAPLPLTHAWVSGVGVAEGAVIVSIDMQARRDGRDGRVVKGIIVRGKGGAACAIEVDSVRGVVRAELSDKVAPSQLACPSHWTRHAVGADGESLVVVDVDAVVAQLGNAPAEVR